MHKQHGILSSLLLALVLAAGSGIVWGWVCGFCGDAIRQRQLRQRPATERVYEQLVVADDGTPLVATISDLDNQYRTYRTLNGELVELVNAANPGSLPGPDALERSSVFTEWWQRICSVSDNEFAPRYWYLIHDGRQPGHAWLEGFDSVTKHRAGYLGRHGFRTTPPPVDDLFPMDLRVFKFASGFGYPSGRMPYYQATAATGAGVIPTWIGYLVTDGKLVEVDVRTRRLRTLIENPGLITAAVVGQTVSQEPDRRSSTPDRRLVAARSADRLWVVDPHTNQSRQYVIPGRLGRSTLEIYLVGDEILLTDIDRSYRTNTASLVWLDRGGRVLRERTVAVRTPQSLTARRVDGRCNGARADDSGSGGVCGLSARTARQRCDGNVRRGACGSVPAFPRSHRRRQPGGDRLGGVVLSPSPTLRAEWRMGLVRVRAAPGRAGPDRLSPASPLADLRDLLGLRPPSGRRPRNVPGLRRGLPRSPADRH